MGEGGRGIARRQEGGFRELHISAESSRKGRGVVARGGQ